MTGIDRLRAIAGAWDEWGLGGTLAEIADEIERERAEDCYRMGFDCGTVWRVVADMERHCLGHEGMEDSPVAHWARELRDALKSYTSDGRDTQNPSCADPDGAADVTSDAQKVTRDPAEDVSMSAYDLLPSDERDAIAWVRKRGGLDYVKREWRSRVPRDRYEARRQRLLGHIAECETALGRRREIISRLTHRVSDLTRENAELRRRAMPEGCQWPRYESGEPVGFGDEVSRLGEVWRICLYRDGSFSLNFRAYSKGERVNRPAPKVLDADGVDTSVGDTVYDVDTGEKMWVCALPEQGAYQCVKLRLINGMSTALDPCRFTHRAPVLAADGKPLREGETIYRTDSPTAFVVDDIMTREDGATVVHLKDGAWHLPQYITHERPDTWERLEEDAGKDYVNYWGCERILCSDCPAIADGKKPDERYNVCHCAEAMKCDIVRRAKALAERERGE